MSSTTAPQQNGPSQPPARWPLSDSVRPQLNGPSVHISPLPAADPLQFNKTSSSGERRYVNARYGGQIYDTKSSSSLTYDAGDAVATVTTSEASATAAEEVSKKNEAGKKATSYDRRCNCQFTGNNYCKCTLTFSTSASSSSSSTSSSLPSSSSSSFPAQTTADATQLPTVLRQRKVRFQTDPEYRRSRENWWDSCGDKHLDMSSSGSGSRAVTASSAINSASTTMTSTTTCTTNLTEISSIFVPASSESVYVNQSYVGEIAANEQPEWDHEQYQDTTSQDKLTNSSAHLEATLISATLSRLGMAPPSPKLAPIQNGTTVIKSALKVSSSPSKSVTFFSPITQDNGKVIRCPVNELIEAARLNELQLLQQLETTKLPVGEYELAVRQLLRCTKVRFYQVCYTRWVQTVILVLLFFAVWAIGCLAWLTTGVSIRYGAVVCFLIATTALIIGMLIFTLLRQQFDDKSGRLLRDINEQLSPHGVLVALAADRDEGHLNVLFMTINLNPCLESVVEILKNESEFQMSNAKTANGIANKEKETAQRLELARSIAFGCAASFVSSVAENSVLVKDRSEQRHVVDKLCLCQYIEKFALDVRVRSAECS